MANNPRSIAVFPSGGDLFTIPCWGSEWAGLVPDPASQELWINFWQHYIFDKKYQNHFNKSLHKHLSQNPQIKCLVFYDLFHAQPELYSWNWETIIDWQQRLPTLLLSASQFAYPEVATLNFDFYWNRCKGAYLDQTLGFKQYGPVTDYVQWPMQYHRRPRSVLSLYGTNNWGYKSRLRSRVVGLSGWHGESPGTGLISQSGQIEPHQLVAKLPAQMYLDNTYISCQLESMFRGANVLYSEKTLDHIIQGRILMNFGPVNFYRQLEVCGWRLPRHIDFSWDSEPDDHVDFEKGTRFNGFIDELHRLASNRNRLHEIFMDNLDVFEHNRSQLIQRPYQILPFDEIDHKYH